VGRRLCATLRPPSCVSKKVAGWAREPLGPTPAIGTAVFDAFLFARYRRRGGEDSFSAWEFSSGMTWENAPAPAHVGQFHKTAAKTLRNAVGEHRHRAGAKFRKLGGAQAQRELDQRERITARLRDDRSRTCSFNLKGAAELSSSRALSGKPVTSSLRPSAIPQRIPLRARQRLQAHQAVARTADETGVRQLHLRLDAHRATVRPHEQDMT
jgi:hypothetical protein